jgi:chromosome segregation protein
LAFVAITHNPSTLARMDRLFGVTMAEKGVSQLVSVELTQAQEFAEAG